MLPTTTSRAAGGSGGRAPYRSYSFLPQYFRRIVKWRQMDIEYTFWQMLYLCLSPKTVYRHTTYRKQTKNHWARDDPAFVVICSVFIAVSATAFCLAFGDSFAHSVLTIISAVCVDFLLIGILLATACWALANWYLRALPAASSHAVEQRVEWLYAFDVHCNSYFPLFIALYVVQYFFVPLLLSPGFLPALLSVLLYVTSFSYYHYLNFLGYNALPFLERTEYFLYPIGAIILTTPIAVLSGFNPTRFALSFYFGHHHA
eukprot:jgi/Chlat1/4184/Chrsp27S04281